MTETRDRPVSELTSTECWSLLSTADLGRIAVVHDGLPDIFPVNYLASGERTLYFRSAPGSKLMDIAEHPGIAFEADGTHDGERWSVVVTGRAHRLGDDTEIERSGVLGLASYSPTEKWNYVRIEPSSISGRRFRRVHSPAASHGRKD